MRVTQSLLNGQRAVPASAAVLPVLDPLHTLDAALIATVMDVFRDREHLLQRHLQADPWHGRRIPTIRETFKIQGLVS